MGAEGGLGGSWAAGEVGFSGARKGPKPGTGCMLESEDPVPSGGLAGPHRAAGARGCGGGLS